MADERNVYVNLSLQIAGYLQNSAKVREANRQTMTDAQKLKAAVDSQKTAIEGAGRGLVTFGTVAVSAFAIAVKKSADFEQRMSQVQAISKATGAQMQALRADAFSAGKAFGLSATQVADAEIELVKAGVSVKDIVGGALPGALALAAAGQLDVGKATEIASAAMTEFKLKGSDVPHVADLLAAGADKSIASVESLGDSLNQSGLVAAQFELSVEDTVGTLTAFSAAGLNGSDAGTSLKTMLTQLASPTKQAQALLEKYNITAFDSKGAFVGVVGLADQLKKGLGGLSQEQRTAALATIFGNDAIRASGALYDLGGKKLKGYIDANNEAGFAALQASKKLDNLNGDVQKLSASFQDDLIKSGSAANDSLRNVTQGATGLLNVFGDLPKGVQATGLGLTGVTGALALTGGAFLLAVPKVAAAKEALASFNLTRKQTAIGLAKGAGLTLGLVALTSALAAAGQQGEATEKQLAKAGDALKGKKIDFNSLVKTGDSFTGIDSFRDALDRSFSSDFAQNAAAAAKGIDGFTQNVTHLGDVYKTNEGAIKAVGQQFASLAQTDYTAFTSSFSNFLTQVGGGTKTFKEMLSASKPLNDQLIALAQSANVEINDKNLKSIATGSGAAAEAVRRVQQAAHDNANALNEMGGSAVDASVDIKGLASTIEGFGSATLDAHGAQRAFEQAVDDASAAFKRNGATLDISTAAGRENQAALEGIASSASAAAAKILEQTGNTKNAAAAVRAGRKDFIDQAIQLGKTRKQAEDYANQLGLIPGNVTTAANLTGAQTAIAKAAALKAAMEALNGKKAYLDVYLNAVNNLGVDPTRISAALIASGRAEGGPIEGPGPKGVDSKLIYAAPGEHMVTAREVQAAGGQGAVYAIRAAMLNGTLRGYASGGAIGEQDRAAARYAAQATSLAKQLKAANAADRAAQKAYDAISGKEADAGRKKAAKARQTAADKRVADLEKRLDAARKGRDDARSASADLRNDREDFSSSIVRGSFDDNPTSLVDQLRSMSRDDKYSAARRRGFQTAANTADKALAALDKRATDAAKSVEEATSSLDDLKTSSVSMASSIASAISGEFRASNALMTTQDQTVTRQAGNLTYSQVVKGGSSVTAAGVAAYYSTSAGSAKAFAAQLQQLAQRGVNGALLAEIAGYGVAAGAPIADALLKGSGSQLASINADYAAIQSAAGSAGQTVSDANFAALIDTAQAQLNAANANAQQITDSINAQATSLKAVIGKAFGLPGYKSGAWLTPGSPNDVAGFVHGQETVLNARQSIEYRNAMRDQSHRYQTAGMQSSGPTILKPADVGVRVSFADRDLRDLMRVEIDHGIGLYDRDRSVQLEVL